jgi:hypothetical protein
MKSRCWQWVLLVLVLLAVVLFLVLEGRTPESAMQSRLAKTMEGNGYTLYTPFRTTDYPGSMFVLAKNNKGRVTEFAVQTFDKTFDVPKDQVFDPNGAAKVQWFDQLKDTFTFGSDIGLELASIAVDADFAGKYVQEVDIKFGDPKLRHFITLARLSELVPNLSKSTKDTLQYLESQGQLDNVYLVLETAQVDSLAINLHLKSEFAGKLKPAELQLLAKTSASVGAEHDGTVSLSFNTPLVIGYKAMAIPQTIVRTQVSAPDLSQEKPIPAVEFTQLKQ